MILKGPKSSNFIVIMALTVVIFVSAFVLLMYFDLFSHNIFTVTRRLGEEDTPYYSLAVALLLFIGLTIVVTLFRNKQLTYIWLIKAFVTLIVMIPYEMYYGLDAYMYYAEAVHFTGIHSHGKAGTFNTIFINYILTYIGGDSYYSLKLLNSFIAYLGIVFLFKSYEHIMKKSGLSLKNDYFVYVLFLFPSILFWSSILGKDPLNLFFVGLFTYGFVRFMDKKRLVAALWIFIGVVGVHYIRSWYSIIMVMSIGLYYSRFSSPRHILTMLIFAPLFYVVFKEFLTMQHISTFQDIFDKMSYTSEKLTYGGSSTEVSEINGLFDYLVYYIPNLFTSLFRPMPWDIRNPFSLLAAVENVAMLYFVYKYIFKNWRAVFKHKYMRFLILFIFSWSLFYVIISPNNLGMAVRFKLQVLPAMLIVIWVSRQIYLKKQKEIKALNEEQRQKLLFGRHLERDVQL